MKPVCKSSTAAVAIGIAAGFVFLIGLFLGVT
jgi:hypothetical protein